MTEKDRQTLLRADALFLLVASLVGLAMDLIGAIFHQGPGARIAPDAPYTAIGFIEAHGLALILAVMLFRANPQRPWHAAALAVHTLLGTANVAFWQIYLVSGIVAAGYITTLLHGLFAVLQGSAWLSAGGAGSRSTGGAGRVTGLCAVLWNSAKRVLCRDNGGIPDCW